MFLAAHLSDLVFFAQTDLKPVMIFIGYAGMNAFTLDFAPGMAVPSEQIPGISKNSGRKKEGED